MNSTGQVYLKRKSIRHTFNTQVAIKNVLIAMAFCLAYLLGKHYQPIHSSSMYGTVNIKYIKQK